MMLKGVVKKIMKIVVKIPDVIAAVKRFEESPLEAMNEMVCQIREEFASALERLMKAEIEIFLGQSVEAGNKRNGYTNRTYGIKGIGAISLRVPRDRDGHYQSCIIPPRRHYDEAIEKDIALLNLAGLSTRMMSHLSRNVLGMKVSAKEVSNSLHALVPAAKAFLGRPLDNRKFKYLFLDGTNFRVQRSTVALEPTLIVVGVDDMDRKSIIAAIQGDKESRTSWEMVFSNLKERGLDPSSIQLGIMDGLPGLANAFREAFTYATVARCWVHKARNVFPRVPRRYQEAFKENWYAIEYADGEKTAKEAFIRLKERWGTICKDAVASIEKDIEELLIHYSFPKEHWDALRTTNPIERVNKEFKRRSKAMEVVSEEGLKVLLAFTALRLEFGWATTPITSSRLKNLAHRQGPYHDRQLDAATRGLLDGSTLPWNIGSIDFVGANGSVDPPKKREPKATEGRETYCEPTFDPGSNRVVRNKN